MKHIKRIDWPTLRDWCLAHGAKNDSIVSIRIDGVGNDFSVILEGNEQPTRLEGRHDVARWRSSEPLRSLP